MENNKNFLIALVAAVGVFVGWYYFYEAPKAEKHKSDLSQTVSQKTDQDPAVVIKLDTPIEVPKMREEVLESSHRVKIETPTLQGSISLKGARFDDLTLRKYRESLAKEAKHITILSPSGSQEPYFAEFGWVSSEKAIRLPDSNTQWQANHETLTPEQSVTLKWSNGEGITFEKIISIDQDYLLTITEKVHNETGQTVTLSAYGLISRSGTPKTSGFFILHEGPIGFLQDSLREYTYKTLQEDKLKTHDSQGGWLGITDKYWLTALIPDQKSSLKTNFRDIEVNSQDRYQVDYLSNPIVIDAGKKSEITTHFFAGAKVLEILDKYEESLGVQYFDKAVDFGWFYFITKPFFYTLNYLHELIGNFGLAILLLTIFLKIIFLPLANKSYRSMGRMKELQPEMERIRKVYAEDKMRMNQEVMDLYKREKVNPMSGCLPMLIQIPVFFALYKVLFISIEMRQVPFYGWIQDLSAPDPTSIFNLFGLIPWDPPSFLMLGAWPLIMGLTMLLQQKLNPAPADPVQAKVFMIMPFMFTIMLASFPAGLVIYWAWNNILSIAQQWLIMNYSKKNGGRSHGRPKRTSV